MRKVSLYFLTLLFFSSTVFGEAAEKINNRLYWQNGVVNEEYVGETISVEAAILQEKIGPQGKTLYLISFPQPEIQPIWVASLLNTLPRLGVGDVVRVQGYLSEIENDDAILKDLTQDQHIVLGLCFFNVTTMQAFSFNPAACDIWQKNNWLRFEIGVAELEKEAAKGSASAYNKLGNRYLQGRNVQRDLVKAFSYFQKAADLDYAVAITNLAAMYDSGLGIKQDYQKAYELYMRAANALDAAGMLNLGIMVVLGNGVKQDTIIAYKWMTLSKTYADRSKDEDVKRRAIRALEITRTQLRPGEIQKAELMVSDWIDRRK